MAGGEKVQWHEHAQAFSFCMHLPPSTHLGEDRAGQAWWGQWGQTFWAFLKEKRKDPFLLTPLSASLSSTCMAWAFFPGSGGGRAGGRHCLTFLLLSSPATAHCTLHHTFLSLSIILSCSYMLFPSLPLPLAFPNNWKILPAYLWRRVCTLPMPVYLLCKRGLWDWRAETIMPPGERYNVSPGFRQWWQCGRAGTWGKSPPPPATKQLSLSLSPPSHLFPSLPSPSLPSLPSSLNLPPSPSPSSLLSYLSLLFENKNFPSLPPSPLHCIMYNALAFLPHLPPHTPMEPVDCSNSAACALPPPTSALYSLF